MLRRWLRLPSLRLLCFCNGTSSTALYALSLHDALPIYDCSRGAVTYRTPEGELKCDFHPACCKLTVYDWLKDIPDTLTQDRKSTRLNSSHVKISYAVFCLKKKTDKSKKACIGRVGPARI